MWLVRPGRATVDDYLPNFVAMGGTPMLLWSGTDEPYFPGTIHFIVGWVYECNCFR